MVDGSSLLLDLDGVVVESVQRLEGGSRLVHVRTAPQWVGICPECGERSTLSKGWAAWFAKSPRMVISNRILPPNNHECIVWIVRNRLCNERISTK